MVGKRKYTYFSVSELINLPTTCACGSKYYSQHSMSCKKRGLVSIRHNDIRDLTANVLKEIFKDIKVEAKLIPLTDEQLQYRSAVTRDETRLNICAQSFWVRVRKHIWMLGFLTQTLTDTSMPHYHDTIK